MRRYAPGAPRVVYCVFDVLRLDGRDVMSQPLRVRKALLAELLSVRPSSVREVGFVEAEGEWLYEQAVALELEGIVAKLSSSTYQPGIRTRDWVKFKRPGHVPPERFRRGMKDSSAVRS